MLSRLIALFITIPLLDLILLIALSRCFGFWRTVLLVILVGIIGAVIAQREGISVIRRIKKELQMGNILSTQLLDGLFVVIGGGLLIIPGIITDVVGLICLIPKSRQIMKDITVFYLKRRLTKQLFRR